MTWARAEIQIKPASVGTGIKVALRQTKALSARMTFTVSDAVGKDLGWSDGDKVEVMIGDAEHHGLLRLRKNNSAGQTVLTHRQMAKGSWFAVPLGHQPAFVDRTEPALWCQWEKVEDGWVEIVLPKWADETRPGKRTFSALPPVTSKQPTRRGADVTASLMGDPEPGRREAMAKISKNSA